LEDLRSRFSAYDRKLIAIINVKKTMQKDDQTTAAVFAGYQKSVTGRMRYVLAQRNIMELHSLDRPLEVLDAAGGNGINAQWLASQGHSVTLLDTDPAMLSQAKQQLEKEGLFSRCRIVEGTLESAPDLLPAGRFDLVLCHHIIEYLKNPYELFTAMHKVSNDRGELSLITLNPVSETIRAIIFRRDPTLARSKLVDQSFDAKWFGKARLYDYDQIVAWGEESGWRLIDFRAVRVLADYISDDEYDEAKEQEAISLEKELSGLEPYRRIGRYLQFSFRKQSL
jgi:S-adenosylmethionine-dependent methyltransferase